MNKKILFLVLNFILNSIVVFADVPWWNSSYKERKQLSIFCNSNETIPSGYTIKTTFDMNSLKNSGKARNDLNDWRVVYWNGSNNVEIDRHISSNDTYFKLQNKISSNSKDYSYYIYYNNSGETGEPLMNSSNVFTIQTGNFVRDDKAINMANNSWTSSEADANAVATYIDENGNIQGLLSSIPRYLNCKYGKGLFVEEKKDNRIKNSSLEELQGGTGVPTGWTNKNGTIVPDRQNFEPRYGTYVMHIYDDDNGNYNDSVYHASINTWLAGKTATSSCYIKQVSSTVANKVGIITSSSGGGGGSSQVFINSTGAVGWARYSCTGTYASDITGGSLNLFCASGWVSIGSEAYFDCVQLEEGSTITSYIPTLLSKTATRAADFLTYTTSGSISANAGSISLWMKSNANQNMWSDSQLHYIFDEGHLSIYRDTSNNLIFTDGVNTTSGISTAGLSQSSVNHIVATWDSSGLKLYLNNAGPVNTTSLRSFALNSSFAIGSKTDNTTQANAIISDIVIYNKAVNSTEVAGIYNGTSAVVVPIGDIYFVSTLSSSLNGYNRTNGSMLTKEPTVITDLSSTDNISGRAGGEVYASDDSLTKIKIPPNTIKKDLRININKVMLPKAISRNEVKQVIKSYEFTAEEVGTGKSVKNLEDTVEISIHLKTDGQNVLDDSGTSIGVGINEASEKLGIGYWNEKQWVVLGSNVAITNNDSDVIVSARTSHLTEYAVVVKNTNIIGINVSPNPFTPAASQYNTITFSFDNTDSENIEIKLWDITGVLVKIITNAGTNSIVWDGRDEYGEIVEAGVYIYQLKVGNAKAGKGTIVVAK